MVHFPRNVGKLCRQQQSLLQLFYTNQRHVSRAQTGDRLSPLTQNTLTGRILLYLNEIIDKNDDIITETPPKLTSNNYISHAILQIKSLRDQNNVKTRQTFKRSVKALDKECCQRSNDFTIRDTLSLLWSFTNVIPHRVTECQYFKLALRQLIQSIHILTKTELVQLIFFIGFLKKSRDAQSMLEQCLKCLDKSMLDSLTKEELCIICNSTFKTSTKIRNTQILNKIKHYINENLDILKDPQFFITLIKSIRHNRFQDDDLLETVTCTILFNKTFTSYNFPAICHILALYSDYLYFDEKILRLLTEQGINQLKKTTYQAKEAYLDTQPRAKDIKRFLWAISNLNYPLLKSDIEEVILPQVEARINAGVFQNDPGTLVEILLYLWILNYKAVDLIKLVLTHQCVEFIKVNQRPTLEKLNLLLTWIYFEDRQLFNSLELYPEQTGSYNMAFQKAKRPELMKISKILKKIKLENSVQKFELSCQVPCINIIGIIGLDDKNNRIVNIEVLDKYTLTKNNLEKSTGLMALKLRILDQYDEGLIVIDSAELEDLTDEEIEELFIDDLDLIC